MRCLHLRHLHLPGLSSYLRASKIQGCIVNEHLKHRAGSNSKGMAKSPGVSPLSPELLTFQTAPTYTCGRREIGKLSEEQIDYLKAGGAAEFHEAQRGGQTTFHGPGQLTAYLVCTLPTHNLNSKKFVHLLLLILANGTALMANVQKILGFGPRMATKLPVLASICGDTLRAMVFP